MSSMWDGLFESTNLNVDPKSAPKAVTVAPAAQTAPAQEPKPKRTRKNATATTTPATQAPAEPEVDAGIFFGAGDTETPGQAGATADAVATLEATQGGDDDFDESDLFGDDDSPAGQPAPAEQAAPAPAPVANPVPETAQPKAKPAGRKAGSKKKTVTADQFAGDMAKVEKGEPVSTGATFPEPSSSEQVSANPVESHDEERAEPSTLSVPYEIDVLAKAIGQRILAEIGRILTQAGQDS